MIHICYQMDETKSLMAMDGLAGLKLLAFKSRDELRWHHFVRHAHFIYPDENSIKGSRTLFAALLVSLTFCLLFMLLLLYLR